MRFPNVVGCNLEGKRCHLPHDFEGDYNVVMLAFDRWHQALVDSWTPALTQLTLQYPNLRFYEVPTLTTYGLRERQMIDGWMRAGIPDRAVRARTITLYTDLRAFFTSLDIYVNTIYTLLLNREGDVLWRTTGAYMPEKMSQLFGTLVQYERAMD